MAPDDQELIRSAQQGNVSAFEQLVYKYDKQVFAIAAQYVRSSDDAKDIYQEVFLRVHNGLRHFKFKSEFSTWLYRVTTNVCLTHKSQRSKHRHESIHEDDDTEYHGKHRMLHSNDHSSSPEQHAMNEEIAFHVEGALALLSPQQRLVFTLRHYQGYKLREIADMMKCTEGTVKRYLFAATRRMREELRGLFE
jgi:RNA polymerase sigma-70 factor (ECF subfamily)